mgnify:FL=1
MKAKYEIIKLLDFLRAKTDPEFRHDEHIQFNPNISKKELYDFRIQINILKWILSDFEYDDNDRIKELMEEKIDKDEDLT